MSLYYSNLYEKVLGSHPSGTNGFLILAGYVGPDPILKIAERSDIKTQIIYGMALDNPKPQLDGRLKEIDHQSDNLEIYYPEIICHSKMYIWLKDGRPIRGFIGSANFSINALKNDYRETLYEVERNQLPILKGYFEIIRTSSHRFKDRLVASHGSPSSEIETSEICDLELFSIRSGDVPLASGLNWGMNPTGESHVNIDDAYVAIRKDHIRRCPKLFPPKMETPERRRQNEFIEIIWDDGEVMQALLEGSQIENSIVYPKQISSSPVKAELGKYLRRRLGVPSGAPVKMVDLVKYGRQSIKVTLQGEGTYYFDFSKP